MAMSRVGSLRPRGVLALLRTQACMSTDASSAAEKVLKAANLQPGSFDLASCDHFVLGFIDECRYHSRASCSIFSGFELTGIGCPLQGMLWCKMRSTVS